MNDWYKKLPPLVQALLTAIVGAVIGILSQWSSETLRPPAPALTPDAMTSVINEVFVPVE